MSQHIYGVTRVPGAEITRVLGSDGYIWWIKWPSGLTLAMTTTPLRTPDETAAAHHAGSRIQRSSLN